VGEKYQEPTTLGVFLKSLGEGGLGPKVLVEGKCLQQREVYDRMVNTRPNAPYGCKLVGCDSLRGRAYMSKWKGKVSRSIKAEFFEKQPILLEVS